MILPSPDVNSCFSAAVTIAASTSGLDVSLSAQRWKHGGENKRTRDMDRVYEGNAVQLLKVRRLGSQWGWLDKRSEGKERWSAARRSSVPRDQTLAKSIPFK